MGKKQNCKKCGKVCFGNLCRECWKNREKKVRIRQTNRCKSCNKLSYGEFCRKCYSKEKKQRRSVKDLAAELLEEKGIPLTCGDIIANLNRKIPPTTISLALQLKGDKRFGVFGKNGTNMTGENSSLWGLNVWKGDERNPYKEIDFSPVLHETEKKCYISDR